MGFKLESMQGAGMTDPPMNETLARGARPQAVGVARYPHLFCPLQLGRLLLPHRFAMAPMTTNFAGLDGAVTLRLCAYLARSVGLELAAPFISCLPPCP